jgi:hypothetical protein
LKHCVASGCKQYIICQGPLVLLLSCPGFEQEYVRVLLLLLLLLRQALVGHFAAQGQPGRVEACVVHLPIMSLDLNQVGFRD